MLKEWYDKGGPQNRPEGYDVKSWIFLPLINLMMQKPKKRDPKC